MTTKSYRIDGLSNGKGPWIEWRNLNATSLPAARKEFREFLSLWTPEGRAFFKLVRVTTTITVSEWAPQRSGAKRAAMLAPPAQPEVNQP